MLVLTRKPGQSVTVGQDVLVAVLQATRGRVKLGFTAPVGVLIYRTEVLKDIAQHGRR